MRGAPLFAQQLRHLGYEPVVDETWVEFDYEVPGGTYSGSSVRMAINVPPDFGNRPPGGIDFKPRFPDRPVRGGPHPMRSHKSRRFGMGGEYWSRPFPNWNQEASKSAQTYMSWVNHLWVTT